MHLSRIAGNITAAAPAVPSLTNSVYFGVVHTLTTSGPVLTGPAAGSQGLTVSPTVIAPVPTAAFSGNCTNGSATAGCGSVPITGLVSTLAFDLSAVRNATTVAWTGSNAATPLNGADGWFVTFSFDEDFGDAPASYQGAVGAVGTAPASHILSNLALGSAFTTNNNYPATLNGTVAGAAPFLVSPVQVTAGTNNNGALGDGVEENGLTTFAPLTTDLIGSTYTLTPTISGATRAGQVCGWIDFNRDGVFTAAEGKCSSFASGATSVPVVWTVPTATTAGNTYMRLRVSYDTTMTTASDERTAE